MNALIQLRRKSLRGLFILSSAALWIAVPSSQATAQVYSQTSQSRRLDVMATARATGQLDQSDDKHETSDALGGFDRSIMTIATTGSPDADPVLFAAGSVQSGHGVTYAPSVISGRLTASFLVEATNADAGTSASASFETELRFERDTPYRLGVRLVSGFNTPDDEGSRDAGGEIVLFDLDTADPDGGPLAIFSLAAGSDRAQDFPFEQTGVIPAGHHLLLRAGADADRELLNNPPPVGSFMHTGSSELTFTLTVPEPADVAILPLLGWMLRRRSR